MSGEGFTIEGGAPMQHAAIAQLVAALCLEIGSASGMKASRNYSPMLVAKQWCGSPKQTKKGVLQDLVIWLYANGGDIVHQWNSINRALGEDATAKLRRKAEKASLEYVAQAVERAQS